MDNENVTQGGAPPERRITVNQVVAWNLAWYRREAGLTQAGLGELIGWTNTAVSEAERSWDGKRNREFDAQTLIGLSLALGIPLNAFFLPPADDGSDATYVFRPPGSDEDLGMADLLGAVIYGAEDEDDTPVRTAYARRLLGAVGEYLGDDWRDEVAKWRLRPEGSDALRELAFRLRGDWARLMTTGADIRAWADALEKAADEGEEP